MNNFNILWDVFHDLHLVRNKLKRWYVFLFKLSNFSKIKSIDETFQLRMIQFSFLFVVISNLEDKMTKSTKFALYFPICMKFNEILPDKYFLRSNKINKMYVYMQVIWYMA